MSDVEFEVVVLGRSRGESVIVRLDDELIVIDSFLANRTPAALVFMKHVGWDPTNVSCVVATHWHDDHVHGLAEILARTGRARFFAPAVSDQDKLARWLEHTRRHRAPPDDSLDATGSFHRVLSVLKSWNQDGHRVKARSAVLHDRNRGVLALALSPTQRAVDAERAAFGDGARDAVDANLTSIALWVETTTHSALLGGDLESHPDFGWDMAITEIADLLDGRVAELVKVPHHGSKDAHAESMWSTLLCSKPHAVLTPYGQVLPRQSDLARLYALAGEIDIAAGPRWLGWSDLGIALSLSTSAHVTGARRPGYARYVASTDGGWERTKGVL